MLLYNIQCIVNATFSHFLRKSNIKVFVQTKHVLIEQKKKDEDFGFKYLSRKNIY